MNLPNLAGASFLDNQGQGTILNDDGVPSFTIDDVAVAEGDAGNVDALFEVSLATASGKTVTAQYATVNGTATSGLDYVGAGGTLTFPPGVSLLVLPSR